MFEKILIANRGEIAVRIIRACQEMGVTSVAVYSEADRNTLHARLADEAICIGPGPVGESYLDMRKVLSATVYTGAEAIHPGYGLLSENEKFARMCAQCQISFIGPTPEAMAAMGHKLNARITMIEHDVPVIPGSTGRVDTLAQAKADAERVGYPVLVKAAAGGGGRGIRRVDSPDQLESAVNMAKAEAAAAFGDDTIYIEKLISGSRHIEFQIMGDAYGHYVHLFERDCSLQMHRQKLIEESPSVALDDELRAEMGAAAVRAARASGYTGVGTVEFLLDREGRYYFIEMNTRVQVEHPVTEMLTGIDIIREQIRIAAGEPLSVSQDQIKRNGHVIECRVCANDPTRNFAPSCGRVTLVHTPSGPGVRFDSFLYNGCEIAPYYDSMVGKIICQADTRQRAIARMKRALGEIAVEGVELNIDFQYDLIDSDLFGSGEFTTQSVEEMMK